MYKIYSRDTPRPRLDFCTPDGALSHNTPNFRLYLTTEHGQKNIGYGALIEWVHIRWTLFR